EAVWLREYIRERLKLGVEMSGISCAGNVCSYDGMEYAPNGYLVFKEIDDRWTLIAWTQVYSAALSQEAADANIRSVIANMIKLRDTRCAGEPAGTYY
ncbi:MAG TPA: hypothetical protein VMZ53_13760, partial [Kofleriaceae bacterium]|nr:hypothetical protein [Kofleriaceae bacterium]